MRMIFKPFEFILIFAAPFAVQFMSPLEALAQASSPPDAAFSSLPQASLQSIANQQTFVISASDGYGISDCLAADRSCGKIVADAWCEAHGRAQALAYGLASDITASLPAVSAAHASTLPPALDKGAIVITCAN